MQRHVRISLALVLPLLVVLLVTSIVLMETGGPEDVVVTEFQLHWLVRAVGGYVAAIAALALLVLGLTGTTPARMLSLLVPLFAGLLVFQVHWGTAVSLAAIAIAAVASDFFVSTSTSRRDRESDLPTK